MRMEQLVEYVRGPMRQRDTTISEVKEPQLSCPLSQRSIMGSCEIVSITSFHANRLEVAELKMLDVYVAKC